jgi:hypothetical protein
LALEAFFLFLFFRERAAWTCQVFFYNAGQRQLVAPI